MNTIELEPETRDLLDRVWHRSEALSTYGIGSDVAEAADGQ